MMTNYLQIVITRMYALDTTDQSPHTTSNAAPSARTPFRSQLAVTSSDHGQAAQEAENAP
jgi:hypothetical protein